MQKRNLSLVFLAAAIVAVTVLGASTRLMAQAEKVLYSFGNGTDGVEPFGDLVFDAAGNAYITTGNGGAFGMGTVCKLTPHVGGPWTEQVLYSFGTSGTDAANPRSGVIFDDAHQNLYGTTINGGAFGMGAVFELSPATGGGWTEKIIFSFNGTDGQLGWDKLVFDTHGNLYSTSGIGGAYGQGVIYELRPHAGGPWTQTVLHNFGGGTDGTQSQGGLIFDHEGNLYGMTTYGGTNGLGTVFELSPTETGWTETVIHNFAGGADGANPFAGVIFDPAGNLYGVTYFGQTVFKMTKSGGIWTLQTLHSFSDNATMGSGPWPTVTLDAEGNIYGTAQFGGPNNGGTAFEMRPVGGDSWAYEVIHSFPSTPTDGVSPSFTPLNFRGDNTFYSTTWQGGAFGGGTLYEIKP
jgi:uncharacterized repeat protein (TIGR03803 family)